MSMTNFREHKGFTTTDGHRYVSIPTDVPVVWKRTRSFQLHGGVRLVYVSGSYEIVRTMTSDSSHRTYAVFRDGDELILSFTGSLREAKAQAVRNAQGLDIFNWA